MDGADSEAHEEPARHPSAPGRCEAYLHAIDWLIRGLDGWSCRGKPESSTVHSWSSVVWFLLTCSEHAVAGLVLVGTAGIASERRPVPEPIYLESMDLSDVWMTVSGRRWSEKVVLSRKSKHRKPAEEFCLSLGVIPDLLRISHPLSPM
jgi:hypothetical protein